MARCMRVRKTAGVVGAVTLLEHKVKVASQSVFYALRTRDGSCASGCGVSQTRVADSFRDRNCRMGPLLHLSFSDGFPRILQLPAFGNPARSGGSQNTPRKFRVRRLKGNDSCCFSLESVHAVLSFEKLYPGDGEQAALDVKTY